MSGLCHWKLDVTLRLHMIVSISSHFILNTYLWLPVGVMEEVPRSFCKHSSRYLVDRRLHPASLQIKARVRYGVDRAGAIL